MGKKDKKNKQKAKGAEKTAKKTEKKANLKLKKELQLKGEEDVEKIIAEIIENDRKRQIVTLEVTEPPSPRSSFSLTAHPEKDELLLFGGEFFNGTKTFIYNDLFVYNIKKNEWLLQKSPNPPPPRCAHQAVALSHDGGQLWIFGGEFASPTLSQFHHYKDLWVFHLRSQTWEKVTAPGGPSARSGHRMVAWKKQLVVFGGFHDNARDSKYFNDVYAFSLENYKWQKLEMQGSGPSPRSGCQMVPMTDGRILIYGGYCKDKLKKDVEKGIVHSDMFVLRPDKVEQAGNKWHWIHMKQTGMKPSSRCGCTMTVFPNNNRAYMFGGVCDEETEESLEGTFYNELYQLDLENGKWHMVTTAEKRKRHCDKSSESAECGVGEGALNEAGDGADGVLQNMDQLQLENESACCQQSPVTETTSTDGVFTVKIGPKIRVTEEAVLAGVKRCEDLDQIVPMPRMNAGLVIKHGILYVYGGVCEMEERTITYADFYSIDLRKMDSWQPIIRSSEASHEWVDSESSEDDSKGEDGEEDEEEDDDDDEEDNGVDSSPNVDHEDEQDIATVLHC